MSGEIGILNVGAGDTKLTFDKSNPAECIRAARIVKDMLRRGYALLIEVERNGEKAFERVREFREDTFEYIIADFDPVSAEEADRKEADEHEQGSEEIGAAAPQATEGQPRTTPGKRGPRKRGLKLRAVAASSTRGVAVARSAGG